MKREEIEGLLNDPARGPFSLVAKLAAAALLAFDEKGRLWKDVAEEMSEPLRTKPVDEALDRLATEYAVAAPLGTDVYEFRETLKAAALEEYCNLARPYLTRAEAAELALATERARHTSECCQESGEACGPYVALERELEAERARREKCEAALRPFAEASCRIDDSWWDHGPEALVPMRFKKGDLDRAYGILKEAKLTAIDPALTPASEEKNNDA